MLARTNVTEAMTALMGRTNSTVPQVEVACMLLYLKVCTFINCLMLFKNETFLKGPLSHRVKDAFSDFAFSSLFYRSLAGCHYFETVVGLAIFKGFLLF
jgi:hypothetical protein